MLLIYSLFQRLLENSKFLRGPYLAVSVNELPSEPIFRKFNRESLRDSETEKSCDSLTTQCYGHAQLPITP